MIPPGVPPDRTGWPEGLLDHLRKFRQGNAVEGFPPVYLGDPSVAVHIQTAAYGDYGPGPIEFASEFPYGLILTQTCDLREEDSRQPSRPWVHIAPIYNGEEKYRPDSDSPKERSFLGSNIRTWLEEGRGPQYLLHLPDLTHATGFWVADLRLVTAVEKGWLMGREPITAFANQERRREVGRRMAMLHRRPAFDGRFEEAVRAPLIRALSDLEGEAPDLLRALYRQVQQFAVVSDDNVDMAWTQVWILARQPLSPEVRQWLEERAAEWQASAAANGLSLLATQYSELDTMTATEYLRLTTMPLSAISPDPPWFGAGTD